MGCGRMGWGRVGLEGFLTVYISRVHQNLLRFLSYSVLLFRTSHVIFVTTYSPVGAAVMAGILDGDITDMQVRDLGPPFRN